MPVASSKNDLLIQDGSIYKMWYSGNDGVTNRIYYATFYGGDKATAVLID